jgi:hypothetical protein
MIKIDALIGRITVSALIKNDALIGRRYMVYLPSDL